MSPSSPSLAPSTSTSTATLFNSPTTTAFTENTPLLNKQSAALIERASLTDLSDDGNLDDGDKGREVDVYMPGKSTFSQTVCQSGRGLLDG